MVSKKSIKILIVDDDRDLCDSLVELFSLTGMNVQGVYNATDAVEIVKREKTSIVITDIHMPIKDGIWLLKEIKKIDPDFPKVLFISGQSVNLELFYSLGIEGFFAKPFNIESVKRAIMRCLLRKKDWLRYPLNGTKGRITKKFYDWEELKKSKQVAFGKSGLFLSENYQFYKVGDHVDFKMAFLSGSPIKKFQGQGVSRWIRKPGENNLPPGVGLEILHIHRDSMSFYLDQLSLLEGPSTIPEAA